MKKGVLFLLYLLPCLVHSEPIKIKVVVVSMFEIGADTGDKPGEFQYWVERFPLIETVPFPQGFRDLRYNAEKGVLGMVTGMGTARSAASIMALGMDSRFDFTESYWLVAGISGVDPHEATLGAAVWAEWLVDGDLGHQIDIREAPRDWSTGYFPFQKTEPYQQPVSKEDLGSVFRLNTGLVHWAYELTQGMELMDTKRMELLRARYVGHPAAMAKPKVMLGDQMASMTFWHGKLLNQWANEWVDYWTEGQGHYVTTAMEDTGTKQSLDWLAKAGKVDSERLLVLRTGSNFDSQPEGLTAAENFKNEKENGYAAFVPSVDTAYRVGSTVVHALLEGWDEYQTRIPQAAVKP